MTIFDLYKKGQNLTPYNSLNFTPIHFFTPIQKCLTPLQKHCIFDPSLKNGIFDTPHKK